MSVNDEEVIFREMINIAKYAAIGKRISDRRKELGMNREVFSEQVGLSVEYMGLLERGERFTRVENLLKISSILCVSTDYILKGAYLPTDTQTHKSELVAFVEERLSNEEAANYFRIMQILKTYPFEAVHFRFIYESVKSLIKYICDTKKPLD